MTASRIGGCGRGGVGAPQAAQRGWPFAEIPPSGQAAAGRRRSSGTECPVREMGATRGRRTLSLLAPGLLTGACILGWRFRRSRGAQAQVCTGRGVGGGRDGKGRRPNRPKRCASKPWPRSERGLSVTGSGRRNGTDRRSSLPSGARSVTLRAFRRRIGAAGDRRSGPVGRDAVGHSIRPDRLARSRLSGRSSSSAGLGVGGKRSAVPRPAHAATCVGLPPACRWRRYLGGPGTRGPAGRG